MAPQNGSINIFVTTTTSGGSAGGGGGGGGGSRAGTAPGKAPQGSPNNPTFVQGTVSFVRLFSPLLALYAIDRTLRAMGLTSSVLNTWIRALGAVWSAIADTLLLPLMPVFTQLLDWSMKGLNWMQNNWPRITKEIGTYIGSFVEEFKSGNWLQGMGKMIGGFFGLSTGAKITTIAGTLIATNALLSGLNVAMGLLGIRMLAAAVIHNPKAAAAIGLGLALGYGVSKVTQIAPNYQPNNLPAVKQGGNKWWENALGGYLPAENRMGMGLTTKEAAYINNTNNTTINLKVDVANADEISRVNTEAKKAAENLARQRYLQNQWISDALGR